MHNGPRRAYEIRGNWSAWSLDQENQGRLLDPDQASGGGARPGLSHVWSSHRQRAARLRCGLPEGMTVDTAMVRERETGLPVPSEFSEQW